MPIQVQAVAAILAAITASSAAASPTSTYNLTTTTFNSTAASPTTHYPTYEPTVSFNPTTHYPTYEPTASDSEGEGMEPIPDSDSGGLVGGDRSITHTDIIATTASPTTHYPTYEPTVSFNPTTHYPTYEPTASDSEGEGEGMELIPDSDSGGLVGGDGSITDIILAEYEHQSDSRSFGEVSLLFRFRLFRS